MATDPVPAEQQVLLHHVSWQTYEALLKEIESRAIRLTYDQGSLEILTLSHEHESYAELFGHMILILAEELSIEKTVSQVATMAVDKLGLRFSGAAQPWTPP
jgi:hypothetical protein